MYLLDTNVVSELRKGRRADANVTAWLARQTDDHLFLSVLVIGELRRGITSVARRDKVSATNLEAWVNRLVHMHNDRILPITLEIAQQWGRINVPDQFPVIDSLLAATAQVHGLTFATRNAKDIARSGVPTVDPFQLTSES
jgi:toxin FitB